MKHLVVTKDRAQAEELFEKARRCLGDKVIRRVTVFPYLDIATDTDSCRWLPIKHFWLGTSGTHFDEMTNLTDKNIIHIYDGCYMLKE